MSLTRGFRSKTARDGNNTKQLKHTRDCEHCAHNYKAVERIRQTIIGKYLLQSPISILVSNYMLIEANMGDSNRIIIFFGLVTAICLEKGCKLPQKTNQF